MAPNLQLVWFIILIIPILKSPTISTKSEVQFLRMTDIFPGFEHGVLTYKNLHEEEIISYIR